MNLVTGQRAAERGAATIGVRPEHLIVSRDGGAWRGVVGIAEHLGSDTLLHVQIDGIGQVTARADGDAALRHGDTVFLTPDPARIHRFDTDGKAL